MKTPDEIKKGLECCAEYGDCSNRCPYNLHKDCGADLYSDALAYIQQLERERDAAVEDLEMLGDCETCLHDDFSEECKHCCDVTLRGNWQWRGVQGVE